MKTLLATILILFSVNAMADIVTVCDETGCKTVIIFK